VVVMSPVGEVIPGRRYHVRRTRTDGLTEETIKTLVTGDDGQYWLKPESNKPEFQQWIALDGAPGESVHLVGCVRYVLRRES
ncbi:MAG: hypothetical protein ACRECA_13960, partial [Pseudolabrys sp.]